MSNSLSWRVVAAVSDQIRPFAISTTRRPIYSTLIFTVRPALEHIILHTLVHILAAEMHASGQHQRSRLRVESQRVLVLVVGHLEELAGKRDSTEPGRIKSKRRSSSMLTVRDSG
jgi:hypothetical protein